MSKKYEQEKRVWLFKPFTNGQQKTPLMRGYRCYRGGCILMAAPLRLDNQFIFHSVSATNYLQKYTFFELCKGF